MLSFKAGMNFGGISVGLKGRRFIAGEPDPKSISTYPGAPSIKVESGICSHHIYYILSQTR
jgi:hypothetical protein